MVGETFPCDPLAPTYVDEDSGLVMGRSELQRRSEYMRSVNIKLRAIGQLRADQPFIRLIQQCLQNLPAKRPVIHEVQCLLEEASACFGDGESERNRHDLVQALQTQPGNLVRAVHSLIRFNLKCDLWFEQNMQCVIRDLVTENADLQSRMHRVQSEAQQQLREMVSCETFITQKTCFNSWLQEGQLQSSEREKATVQQQLTRKEAELMKAEETIRREQQQLREKVNCVGCVHNVLYVTRGPAGRTAEVQ